MLPRSWFRLNIGLKVNETNKKHSDDALHYPAQFSNKRKIEFSIEKCISVNVIDYKNEKPLLLACQKASSVENVISKKLQRKRRLSNSFSGKRVFAFLIGKREPVNVIIMITELYITVSMSKIKQFRQFDCFVKIKKHFNKINRNAEFLYM